MEKQVSDEQNNKKREILRIGLVVFILLVALTLAEYFIGSIAIGWTWPLWIIAIIKAALILRDYMHVNRLFTGEEESH
jgi:cytochrome c oxidase subunit IV